MCSFTVLQNLVTQSQSITKENKGDERFQVVPITPVKGPLEQEELGSLGESRAVLVGL